jgi:hypothetical protein
MSTRKVWVIERQCGRSFTTYREPRIGTEVRVDISSTRIGPFDSVSAAADWLSSNAVLHYSYEIQEEKSP